MNSTHVNQFRLWLKNEVILKLQEYLTIHKLFELNALFDTFKADNNLNDYKIDFSKLILDIPVISIRQDDSFILRNVKWELPIYVIENGRLKPQNLNGVVSGKILVIDVKFEVDKENMSLISFQFKNELSLVLPPQVDAL